MIEDLLHYAAGVLVLGGALFSLLATIGLLRLPDVYTRLHAGSKAGLVGAGFVLVAVMLTAGELAVILRAFCGIVFLALTTPVSAHLLAKAAWSSGVAASNNTRVDEMPADRTTPTD